MKVETYEQSYKTGNVWLGEFPDKFTCTRSITLVTELDSQTGNTVTVIAKFVQSGVEFIVSKSNLSDLTDKLLELGILKYSI